MPPMTISAVAARAATWAPGPARGSTAAVGPRTVLGKPRLVSAGATKSTEPIARAVPATAGPLSAILNRGTGPAVYVVDGNVSLLHRPVTVASFTEDSAIVTAGVGAGDKVVTLGAQKLEAGLKVRTIETR